MRTCAAAVHFLPCSSQLKHQFQKAIHKDSCALSSTWMFPHSSVVLPRPQKSQSEFLSCMTEGWVAKWATLWFLLYFNDYYEISLILSKGICPLAFFSTFFPLKKKGIKLRCLQALRQVMLVREASHSGMVKSEEPRTPPRSSATQAHLVLGCVNTATHCSGFRDCFSRAHRFLNFYTTHPSF